jgi:hypothetical protein
MSFTYRRKNMSRSILLLTLAIIAVSANAQPTVRDQATYRPELDKAFASLRGLNEQQMKAVAGLVLAAKANIDVVDYCPPLKQFTRERWPCEGAMISYARARADCKKDDPTWKECPKVLEADANWAACETKLLGERLIALQLVKQWPKPKPQPLPVR